ncbi:MAG: hypothetical protein EXR91_13125 [Gemmatimonadetes bacterium]|nr:hypothetical protein [Gemmatimonadota bacterium]
MTSAANSLPMSWPHAACVRMDRFRRSWVKPSLTEENWDQAGVLYFDATGIVTYGTVVRFEQFGETEWLVSREHYVEGRFQRGPRDELATRAEAIDALMAEVAESRAVRGSVPVEDWPEDADNPWIVFSVPSRSRP